MRRVLATVCLAASVGTSCGALADDTAGSVGDRSVSVDDVSALTLDAVQVDGGAAADSEDDMESVLPGTDARQALVQLMLSEAVAEVVEAAGLEIDRAAAEEQVQASGGSLEEYSERTRDVVLTQLGGLSALNEWYLQLDLADEADARELYELAPGLWERRCVVVASATDLEVAEVQRRADDGIALEQIAGQVAELELTEESGRCTSLTGLLAGYTAGADTALIEELVVAEVGEVSDPVPVGESTVWFEVVEVQPGDPASMVEELTSQGTQFDPTLVPVWWLLEDSTVNPRYGTEVQLREGLTIGRPQAPEVEPVTDLGGAPNP
jgi:hypothetical protein